MMIFIANQFVGDKVSTGGDVLAVEIAKRVKDELIILAPSQIHPEILKALNHGVLVDTDKLKTGSGTASSLSGGISTIIHYLIRSCSASTWLLKNTRDDDVVYLTGDFICNTFPAWILKKKKPNIKVLANYYHRNPLPGARRGNNYFVSCFSRLLQGISLKIIRRIAYKVFVLSKVGAEDLRKDGFPLSQIVISGAGVNNTKQKSDRTKKRDQIVFIGRLNVTKGAFDLIEIFQGVNKKNKNLKLVMLGSASESDLNKLNELVRQHKLEGRVIYRGFVSEEVKNRILSESKALILPSKEEGFGIVIMEALAFGIPVICYDLPALRAVFSKYKLVNFIKSFEKIKFTDKIIEVVSGEWLGAIMKTPTWEGVYKIQSRYF